MTEYRLIWTHFHRDDVGVFATDAEAERWALAKVREVLNIHDRDLQPVIGEWMPEAAYDQWGRRAWSKTYHRPACRSLEYDLPTAVLEVWRNHEGVPH